MQRKLSRPKVNDLKDLSEKAVKINADKYNQRPEGSFTTMEFALANDISRVVAQERIKTLVEAGVVKACKKKLVIIRPDGRVSSKPLWEKVTS